jgi:hypothetical protein
MADKVLQDPTKQKLFEHSSLHELFELPRKAKLNVEAEERMMARIDSTISEPKGKISKDKLL